MIVRVLRLTVFSLATTIFGLMASRATMAQGIIASAADSGQFTNASIKAPSKMASPVVSDADITTQIKSKFAADGDINPFNIDVDTNEGVVTLKGTVKRQTTRRRAAQLARRVSGVRRVVNLIKVDSKL
jgi:osmotically-inducible protein OsmY